MNYITAISKFDIVNKDGITVPFTLNKEQERFLENMSGRDCILKSRQIGFSSLILAIFALDFLLIENSRSVCISHDTESAQRLLDRVKFFLESAQKKGLKLNLKYNNRNELVNQDIGSTFYIGKAGSKSFGRGDTLTNLHLSEFAFYPEPERMLASVLQAVIPKGKVVVETTPNGVNYFKTFWEKSKREETNFKCHFFDNTFYDPKTLDKKQKELGERLFKQEYPSNDSECFLYSGDPFFSQEILQDYLNQCKEPIKKGYFVGQHPVAFEDDLSGKWSLWDIPNSSHDYAISADVAETQDFCSAVILDLTEFKVVGTYHGRIEAGLFGHELASAGHYFNTALLVPEKNNQGLAVLQRLRDLYYPRIYTRQVFDSSTQQESTDFGWLTTTKTRPLMLSTLQAVIKQKTLEIRDAEAIKEMMSFARNDKGKPEAVSGSHDDRVISLAIAIQIHDSNPKRYDSYIPDYDPKKYSIH
jgi:hypothetical protein